jgi:hypothetical protein
MDNYTSLVSSYVICFASQIFSHMNKCFSGSCDVSPLNSSNLMMGSCPAILNVELLPFPSVDPLLMLPELDPLVVSPCVDVLLVVFLSLKFGCLNSGVLSGVLVAHRFMGSTLTVIWIGVMPMDYSLGPIVFI